MVFGSHGSVQARNIKHFRKLGCGLKTVAVRVLKATHQTQFGFEFSYLGNHGIDFVVVLLLFEHIGRNSVDSEIEIVVLVALAAVAVLTFGDFDKRVSVVAKHAGIDQEWKDVEFFFDKLQHVDQIGRRKTLVCVATNKDKNTNQTSNKG